jgi:HEAT repeat protein
MASKPPRQEAVEQSLETLNALQPTADRALQNAVVRKHLEDRHFRVVAKAASLAEERTLHERVPDLLQAYPRFAMDPVKRDPKCIAKQAIARALVALDCQNQDFFLQGIRYRQPEPVWGGSVDAAIDVRCSCAMGLVASGYPRAIQELTELLDDPEWRARAGAARAIACGHPGEAEALLRFKVRTGDPEPEVLGECFTGLLAIAAEESVALVAGHMMGSNDGVRDFAALALGESRHPRALDELRAAWDTELLNNEFRAVLIRAAALHRTEAAFDWLIRIIEQGSRAHADVAAEALGVYERNSRLLERVQTALAGRSDGNGH